MHTENYIAKCECHLNDTSSYKRSKNNELGNNTIGRFFLRPPAMQHKVRSLSKYWDPAEM